MLQSMREGAQSTAAKVIIGLIVLSFAGFGLESLLPGGSGTSVAEVNGTDITPQALQQAINQQKQRLTQILGEQIDPAMLEDDRLRPAALEGLIQRELMLQAGKSLGMTVSQREIGRSVAGIEAFQVDGQFNPDQYKRVLAGAGYSPESFRRAQAEDLLLDQLQRSLLFSEFVTPLETQAAANIGAERRDVRYIDVPSTALGSGDEISDEAIATFYADNPDRFMEPLRLVADYVVVAIEDYIEPVDESVLRAEFDAVRDDYVIAEQARVAHVLLTQRDDESDAEFQQRIAEVEVRLAADDRDFAALAAEFSDDIGSSAFGGELGLTDGSAFPEPMEEAIAALEPGQISAPVETDAGTHFILLQERLAGEAPDFETLRPELEASIQTAEAQRQLLLDTDTLRDLAFNSADLKAPSEAIGATVQRSAPFSETAGEGDFAVPAMRRAAFSPEVLTQGNNSELIELDEGRFAVLRVVERIEPARKPLDAVREQIAAELRSAAEEEALLALEQEVRDRLAAGETVEAIASTRGLEWQVELAATRLKSQLPRPVLTKAFAMSADAVGNVERVEVPGSGYALVQLVKITAGSTDAMDETQLQVFSRQTAAAFQRATLDEFTQSLRQEADVVVR